jgi:NAD(P)H-flavin reductase
MLQELQNKNQIDPMIPIPFVISKIKKETKDTFTIELDTPNKFEFKAGQFNMLYLFGVGEVAISISGDPSKREKLVHTIRNVGSVTNRISNLKKNDVLGVRGPFGSSWQIEKFQNKDILIIAGGLGLAPVRPIIYYILNNRNSFNKVTILYGTKNPNEIIFKNELHKWKSSFDIDLQIIVDNPDSNWKGNTGLITTLIRNLNVVPDNTITMICGPEIMMKVSAIEIASKGLNPQNIYLSMERNMKCAIGLCGHCQYGSKFICKDGPVFSYLEIKHLLDIWEL